MEKMIAGGEVKCSKYPASIAKKGENDDCDSCNDYVYEMLENVFGFLCEVVEMRTNDVSGAKNNLEGINENREGCPNKAIL